MGIGVDVPLGRVGWPATETDGPTDLLLDCTDVEVAAPARRFGCLDTVETAELGLPGCLGLGAGALAGPQGDCLGLASGEAPALPGCLHTGEAVAQGRADTGLQVSLVFTAERWAEVTGSL